MSLDDVKHEVNLTTVAFGCLQEFLIYKGIATKEEMEKVNNNALKQYKKLMEIIDLES